MARGFTGATAKRWDKADNAGPVTEADLAVNDLLLAELRGARADYGWLSEETEDNTDRLGHKRVFIIDPIDGTRSFVEGSDTWQRRARSRQLWSTCRCAICYTPPVLAVGPR